MADERVTRSELFELRLDLPDPQLDRLASRLVGFSERHERLRGHVRVLIDEDGLEQWSRRNYGRRVPLLDAVEDRYPLVVFHGDVGTGKTATAEAVSNALAREIGREGTLFKLSTRVRGTGYVGQMSWLINQAFQAVTAAATENRLSFMIIDEADFLAESRESGRSHHEDKVAVNTLIQKVDDVRRFGGRVLVFLCTNRFSSLDPAVVRRAGHVERFDRPSAAQREELLRLDCDGLGLPDATFEEVVRLTGSDGAARPVGYTYSDLRTRLLPEALARAYPQRGLESEDLIEIAKEMDPSPAMEQPDRRES